MSDFAVVMGFKLNNEDYQSIVLDTISDVNVGGSSRITEQPIISGDVVSDHMYTDPKTLNIIGSISMNDSKVTVINGSGSKLANFEELFERIQKEGVRCDIVKISLNNEDDIRFLHRGNMVIQRYSWIEKINSLDYNISFREVMTTTIIDNDIDEDDAFLPTITEPNTLSFTDTLIDWDLIDNSVVKILKDEGLITEMFLNSLKSLGMDMLKSLIPTAVALVIVGVMAALNTTPVGWVITAVVAAVAAAYFFVKGLVNFFKRLARQRKYLVDVFEWTKNDKKNEAEIKRFGEFIKSIHDEFEKVNDILHVYQISSNENQECMLSIGDSYYIFTFTKNNLDGKYGLKVQDINNREVGSKTDITTSPSSFDQLNNSNHLFIANNNSKVYIVYNQISEEEMTDDDKKIDPKLNLKNYSILVADMNVEEFEKLIEDIIKSKIFRNYN